MLSVPHMIVVFLVVLVVFGPQKLPELARSLGKLMAEFRKASTDFRSAFEEEMRDLERQARLSELRKQAAEAVTAATIAETTAQHAQNAKNPPNALAAPTTGVEALPAPFSAERAMTEGPVITPVAEAVPRVDAAVSEAGSKEEGSKEAGSKEEGSKEAGSKEEGSSEQVTSKNAASDGANGESATDESVAATESTPSHDQQQPA
jgi:sec-independent protein translocase protein TatB